MNWLTVLLRKQAAEIAAAEHDGWGNTMSDAADEIERLRAALLDCARQAEALKRDCGMDPETPQALRNAQYQAISTTAHIALGSIRGPSDAARDGGAT